MNIELFGRLIFIGAGALIVITTTWPRGWFQKEAHIKPPNFKILVLAVLCLGVGTFGQEFLPKYSKWLEIVGNVVKNPGQKSYTELFDNIGKGNLPVELQEVGINYAVSHPIEGMETILNNSINKAPKNKEGEKALQWAIESYNGKKKEIDYFAENKANINATRQFSPATRQLVYNKIQKLPDNRKRALGIDANSLQAYEVALEPFPKNVH